MNTKGKSEIKQKNKTNLKMENKEIRIVLTFASIQVVCSEKTSCMSLPPPAVFSLADENESLCSLW